MVPAGYSCFRARCGITPFEGCGYESVVGCLGWAGGAIRGLRLYRRGYPVGFGELSELFVGLGYTGEAIRWSRPCPQSYPMAHFCTEFAPETFMTGVAFGAQRWHAAFYAVPIVS